MLETVMEELPIGLWCVVAMHNFSPSWGIGSTAHQTTISTTQSRCAASGGTYLLPQIYSSPGVCTYEVHTPKIRPKLTHFQESLFRDCPYTTLTPLCGNHVHHLKIIIDV